MSERRAPAPGGGHDPELAQMLRDARAHRAHRAWPVRAWHAGAEWLNVTRVLRRRNSDGRRGIRPGDLPTATDGTTRETRSRERLMVSDDVRHALKRLRHQPGSAIVCVLMLALAIGVTAAMFTITDHMLLRPAPYKDPNRLRTVWVGQSLQQARTSVAAPLAQALRASTVFEDVFLFAYDSAAVFDGSGGLTLDGFGRLTPNTFRALGVAPALGRAFTDADVSAGALNLVVLSDRSWREHFNADPSVIGRDVRLNGQVMTIVGVMPAGFRFPSDSTGIWRPMDINAPTNAQGLSVYARMARGIPEDDVRRAAAEATRSFAKDPSKHGIILRPLASGFVDDYTRTAIQVLMAGVSLVFLVLCANAANLILARTTRRRSEFGVCTALGASRSRLILQVAAENVAIGLAAGVIGLGLAALLISAAAASLPQSFLWRTLNPIALDMRTVLVSAGLALAAAIAAGVPPAWFGTRTNAADAMRAETRGASESRASRRWAAGLLIGEIALASTLLVGAGLLVGSFVRLTHADPGLDTEHVTTVQLTLPSFAFVDKAAKASINEQLRTSLAAMPGVTRVSQSFGLPPSGGGFTWDAFAVDGVRQPGDPGTTFMTDVSPDFFDVFGIRIVEGRPFTDADGGHVMIVSTGLAKRLFGATSPLGHTLTHGTETMTIVGVANEVRSSLSDPREDHPEYYTPLTNAAGGTMYLGLRCAAACSSEGEIRARVKAASASVLVYKVQTMAASYYSQFEGPRTAASVAFGFSVVALVAAAAGLFSILTYAVNRRRREFGIRSAMGASPQQLRRLILRDGLLTAGAGLALGAAMAAAAAKTVNALVYGVAITNPPLWLGVAAVIVAVTLGSAWRPARDAAKTNPIELLRES